MNEQAEFQRFARILSRYRGGALRLGARFAELPPGRTQRGALGGECVLLGEQGAREWTAIDRPAGRWAAHLWDAMPGVSERALRAAGFERQWSNSILETRVNVIEVNPSGEPAAEPRAGEEADGARSPDGGSEPFIGAISTAAEYSTLSSVLGEDNVPVWTSQVRILTARVRGILVGAASLTFDDEVAYLADLYVVPGHRGRGYGRALIEAAFEHAARKGCTRVWTLPSEKARPLYERAGFRPVVLLSTYLQATH